MLLISIAGGACTIWVLPYVRPMRLVTIRSIRTTTLPAQHLHNPPTPHLHFTQRSSFLDIMVSQHRFDPRNLNPDVLDEVLQPLSNYFISKRRLKIRERSLGQGGFGTVKMAHLWRSSWAQIIETPSEVAVKQLKINQADQLRLAFRLAREMNVWVSLKHENILEFTGYYLSDDFGEAYLISPYMENGNIQDYLSGHFVSLKRRADMVLDTIKGLHYLHTRTPPVVHGDLKSVNVLVKRNGGALLSDFGLASTMQDKATGLSTSNGFKGTIRYCSPELLRTGLRNAESDIWAWGCLTLEVLTRYLPYTEIENEMQVLLLICGDHNTRKTPEPSSPPSLPSVFFDLMRECWEFDASRRPDSQRCMENVKNILQTASASTTMVWSLDPTLI